MSVYLISPALWSTHTAHKAWRLRESGPTPVLPTPVADGSAKSLAPAPIDGPSPCDACPSAERCRTLMLACCGFELFVDGRIEWEKAARHPTRRRYVRLYGDATPDDALDEVVAGAKRHDNYEERGRVGAAIAQAGSIPRAAALLGVPYDTLWRRLKRWGLATRLERA
jgi:regulatory Fis family protein